MKGVYWNTMEKGGLYWPWDFLRKTQSLELHPEELLQRPEHHQVRITAINSWLPYAVKQNYSNLIDCSSSPRHTKNSVFILMVIGMYPVPSFWERKKINILCQSKPYSINHPDWGFGNMIQRRTQNSVAEHMFGMPNIPGSVPQHFHLVGELGNTRLQSRSRQ